MPHALAITNAPLGFPVPESPDAVSVSLPRWGDVIGYEEGDDTIRRTLQCGYPRFVLHPEVQRLNAWCEERHGRNGERALVVPSKRVAGRCVDYIRSHAECDARFVPLGVQGVTAVLTADAGLKAALQFWQHTGWIVSSRLARSVCDGLAGKRPESSAKARLRVRIAKIAGCSTTDVFLYPSGMAAITDALDAVRALGQSGRTVQFGFPYVDLLKVQERLGGSALFYPRGSRAELAELTALLDTTPVDGVFCEVPGNPLLHTIDLPALSAELRARGVPLIVDDSIGCFANLRLLPHVDLAVASLTKYFSGRGTVMGGALIVSPHSPTGALLHAALRSRHEDLLWIEDALVLEQTSRDYARRLRAVNATALSVARFLNGRDEVAAVYHPSLIDTQTYDALRKPDGGYGGLISICLKGGERAAEAFYDALDLAKGPGFGMDATMASPSTLLAHYHELDWAEKCGVPRDLIRISVGLESFEDLKERLVLAFDAAQGLFGDDTNCSTSASGTRHSSIGSP